MDAQSVASARPGPPISHWYTAVLLAFCYALSYLDRKILALLLEPIKQSLELSDTQMGMLLGPAFAISYIGLAIPIAFLADRKSRKHIIAGGIALWSLVTVITGTLKNFGQLFAARIFLGAGEAALGPAAISLISDMFPKESRARAIAIYTMGGSIGGGIAYAVTGTVYDWAKNLDLSGVPLFSQSLPWQITFVLLGLPGFLFAAAVFFKVKEPKRTGLRAFGEEGKETVSLTDTARYIANKGKVFGCFCIAASVIAVMNYVQDWNATLFSRVFGWDQTVFGQRNGLVLLVVGPLSVLTAGSLADWFHRRGHSDGAYRVVLIGTCLLVPTCAIYPIMPDGWSAFVINQLSNVGVAFVAATSPTVLVSIAPGQIRGQAMALYFVALSCIGLLLGPTSVGTV